MLRRLPVAMGALAALVALLLVGPVAVAVAVLRSSSDSRGPDLAAQIFIALLVLAAAALAGVAAWGLTRLLIRHFAGPRGKRNRASTEEGS